MEACCVEISPMLSLCGLGLLPTHLGCGREKIASHTMMQLAETVLAAWYCVLLVQLWRRRLGGYRGRQFGLRCRWMDVVEDHGPLSAPDAELSLK
jgi:hypothetical protein